jgi:hypothetical protein
MHMVADTLITELGLDAKTRQHAVALLSKIGGVLFLVAMEEDTFFQETSRY